MSTRNALYEFMPYGAPELQDASRTYMARSVALSALGWAVLFTVVLFALRQIPAVVMVELPDVSRRVIDPLPPPLIPEAQHAIEPVQPAKGPPPDAGRFEAVKKDVVEIPPAQPAPPDVTRQPVEGGGSAVVPVRTIGPGVVTDTVPGFLDVPHVDVLPAEVSVPKPVYPQFALDAQVEGMVYVRVLVDRTGHARQAVVMGGVPLLAEAAREAALRAVFTPALVDGHPVSVWVTVPYRFRLH